MPEHREQVGEGKGAANALLLALTRSRCTTPRKASSMPWRQGGRGDSGEVSIGRRGQRPHVALAAPARTPTLVGRRGRLEEEGAVGVGKVPALGDGVCAVGVRLEQINLVCQQANYWGLGVGGGERWGKRGR